MPHAMRRRHDAENDTGEFSNPVGTVLEDFIPMVPSGKSNPPPALPLSQSTEYIAPP